MSGKNLASSPSNDYPQASGIIEGFYKEQPMSAELRHLLDLNITEYTSPASFIYALHYLTKAMVLSLTTPSPELTELKYRIDAALRDGAPPVMTYTNFIKTLFHTNDVGRYEKLLQLAEEAKIIRIVQGSMRRGGRIVRYVVLNTDARICGNCYYYGTTMCPKAKGVMDVLALRRLVRPTDDACEKFEPFWALEEGSE